MVGQGSPSDSQCNKYYLYSPWFSLRGGGWAPIAEDTTQLAHRIRMILADLT